MTKHEAAIHAVLPIIHNALSGALDQEEALRWIEHLLKEAASTEHDDQVLLRAHHLSVTSENVEEADKELATLIPELVRLGFAHYSGENEFTGGYLWCYSLKGIDRLEELHAWSDKHV